MFMRSAAFAAILLVCGCGGGGGGGSSSGSGGTPVPDPNSPPTSNAGADYSRSIDPAGMALDGSASSDPDGHALSYTWSVASQPAGASASIASASSATTTFTSGVPGDYVFSLSVSDGRGGSDTDTVAITLVNDPPVAAVDAFQNRLAVGDLLILDGSGSTDQNGQTLSFDWRVTSFPPGSSIEASYSGAAPEIIFDVEGEYRMELEVSDGYASDTITLDPVFVDTFAVAPITAEFADAEYDDINKRVVALNLRTLTIIDADGTERSVTLPLNGNAVSVAPDGGFAAIAHGAFISYVNLSTATIVDTYPVSANLGDIVLDGNGYAHGFPSTGQWNPIRSMNMTTGALSTSTGRAVYMGIKAKLHPSGDRMYGADNGVSPNDIERYTIDGGSVVSSYDSPYHGDYSFCGDLYMGPGGETILTRCGTIVRATNDQSSDMTFVTTINEYFLHASASDFTGRWFGVVSGQPASVSVYNAENASLVSTLIMPFVDGVSGERWQAHYAFASDDSARLFVLASDSAGNNVLLRTGGDRLPETNVAPSAVVQRYATAYAGDVVTVDGSQSYDPEGYTLSYQWQLLDQPDGSNILPTGLTTETLSFTPQFTGTYEFELVVNDGVRDSAAQTVSVNVFDTGDTLVHRLDGEIADAEYSKSLNALVYISATARTLHIVDLAGFGERIVQLPRDAYSVGISPDGQFAAVAHVGRASLVDLSAAAVVDEQDFGADFGDIVLDDTYRAHLVPRRDQHVDLYTIDFAGDQWQSTYGTRAGTQIRMHPTQPWVYGADRGVSPADFEKWDVSGIPPVNLGDSPYHGDYPISGNIWISEHGTQLLVASGRIFHSAADATDMTYAGTLETSFALVPWADHSTEAGKWAVLSNAADTVLFFGDDFFAAEGSQAIGTIPTATGDVSAKGYRVFYSDDGMDLVTVLEATSLADPFAIEVRAAP